MESSWIYCKWSQFFISAIRKSKKTKPPRMGRTLPKSSKLFSIQRISQFLLILLQSNVIAVTEINAMVRYKMWWKKSDAPPYPKNCPQSFTALERCDDQCVADVCLFLFNIFHSCNFAPCRLIEPSTSCRLNGLPVSTAFLPLFQVYTSYISFLSFEYQLYLFNCIFFFIALWPWYMKASMIPKTVNTPVIIHITS